MDLVIRAITKDYATFHGRARRKEFWLYILFYVVASMILGFIDGFTGLFIGRTDVGVLSTVFSLALMLPTWAVSARRMHDTNRSGWWVLISLIPILGGIVFMIMAALEGTKGNNRFGPDPLASDGLAPEPEPAQS